MKRDNLTSSQVGERLSQMVLIEMYHFTGRRCLLKALRTMACLHWKCHFKNTHEDLLEDQSNLTEEGHYHNPSHNGYSKLLTFQELK